MTSLSDIIRNRYSCRSYSGSDIEDTAWQALKRLVHAGSTGPFGHTPRFALISMGEMHREEWSRLGTYGFIRNAKLYLAGMIKPGPMAACDYGYCKERLILKATELGINTCWLGGTFSIGAFGRAAGLQPGEVLPTVSPLGYAAGHRPLRERLIRGFAGSDHRKPWPELFFKDDAGTPLLPNDAGLYRDALENVRLAPSASNKQPWRILCDQKIKRFDFYLCRAAGYRHLRDISLQDIDMGIAICHFDLTAREAGLAGHWQVNPSALHMKSLEYVATWQEEN